MRLVSVFSRDTGRRCYINPALVEKLEDYTECDIALGTRVDFASGRSLVVEESTETLLSRFEEAQ
jgi:uncharacterized protein YlzI (FlbEa/FlbD family)